MKAQRAPEEWTGYRVSLPPVFEGPLDLLLHLVKENRIEIVEVEISKITEAYLAALKMMHDLDLDVAGDFLVTAATLVQMKARALLPLEAEAPEDEEASRAELIRLLEEYKRFKEAAGDLEARAAERARLFLRRTPAVPPPAETLAVDLHSLLEAFRAVLARAPRDVVREISRAKVTVEERLEALRRALVEADSLSFLALFRPGDGREVLIATFLALLEAIRMGLAVAREDRIGGEIRIHRGPAFEPPVGEAAEGAG